MKTIVIVALLAAVAYLLGAKDGRARLTRLKESMGKQGRALADAADAAAERVQEKASAAVDHVAETAREAVGRAGDLADAMTDR